jgi:hypothetical protein
MRKLAVLLLCLMSSGWLAADTRAQEGIIFFQHRQFKIPFKNDLKNINVAQVRLYVSSDQGRTWKLSETAAPELQHFRFNTPHDGLFWFAVQTVDQQGKVYPNSLDELRANLRVIVDTAPPAVQVQPLAPRNGQVGVAWQIRDDNLDLSLPDAVRVEYRLPGAILWSPLNTPAGVGQFYFTAPANGQIEVRVAARDRAGNVGEDKTTVSLLGGGASPVPFQNPVQGGVNADPQLKDLARKFVNNKSITLSYELRDVGKSGVSLVELWYTLYKGRTWTKLDEFPIDVKNAGEGDLTKKLAFNVTDEGIYGISLAAKSGVGLGERAPQPGDRPQFWIEVDCTKPVAQVLNVHVGTGIDKGTLAVAWNAQDKNLALTPIRLSYAEQKDGPWTTFADKLTNNGKHVWKMPEQLPFQFYVRVEAFDLAGNIGEAITSDRVKVDLSQPKALIRDIEPGQ